MIFVDWKIKSKVILLFIYLIGESCTDCKKKFSPNPDDLKIKIRILKIKKKIVTNIKIHLESYLANQNFIYFNIVLFA